MDIERLSKNYDEVKIEVDVIKFINIFLKYWKLIIYTFFLLLGTTTVYLFIVTPRYTSRAIILTSDGTSEDVLTQMEAVAAYFKVAQPTLTSPEVYKEIIRSRNLIEYVSKKRYISSEEKTPKSLTEIFRVDTTNLSPQKISYVLFKRILNSLKVEINKKSGSLTIDMETNDPILSMELVASIIEELENFNKNIRIIKAKDRREFIEKRLDETRAELKKAEEQLKKFREENRQIVNSPQLQLEYGRLMREVSIQEEIFITLTKEYELAKIQERKDTAIIDVIENPEIPVTKSYPKRFKTFFIASFVSLFVGLLLSVCIENIKQRNIIQRLKETDGFVMFSRDLKFRKDK